jgi:hypothetical protein
MSRPEKNALVNLPVSFKDRNWEKHKQQHVIFTKKPLGFTLVYHDGYAGTCYSLLAYQF